MSQIFLGSAFKQHMEAFRSLPIELFDLIDDEGVNVVASSHQAYGEYRCTCLLKFIHRDKPFEVYITFPEHVFKEIVYEIDLANIGVGVH